MCDSRHFNHTTNFLHNNSNNNKQTNNNNNIEKNLTLPGIFFLLKLINYKNILIKFFFK